MKLLQKTHGQGRGWRLLVPILPSHRTDYSAVEDSFVTGWWWFAIGVGVERIGVKHLHGVGLRITWGWVTDAKPKPEPEAVPPFTVNWGPKRADVPFDYPPRGTVTLSELFRHPEFQDGLKRRNEADQAQSMSNGDASAARTSINLPFTPEDVRNGTVPFRSADVVDTTEAKTAFLRDAEASGDEGYVAHAKKILDE